LAVVATALVSGCATAPRTQQERQSLVAEADAAVSTMTAKDPTLRSLIDRAPGYAVFPNVGKGGLIAGAAYGRGVVFENGRAIGYTELNQGSIGAQIGGQTYSQLIVFENDASLQRFKAGDFDLGAEVSAVALNAGAAGAANFQNGVAVFQLPKGGLMAAAAINGQKFNFEPMDAATAGDRSTTGPSTRTSDEMELRSDRAADRVDAAADRAESATDKTERRIEQRLDQAEQKADDKEIDVKIEQK
jgi:lipid-binding SYLF domain-containing protein